MKNAKEIEKELMNRKPDTTQAAINLIELNSIFRKFIEASVQSGILGKYNAKKIIKRLNDYEIKLKSFNKLFFCDEVPKLHEKKPSPNVFFFVFINFNIIKSNIKKLRKTHVLNNSTNKIIKIVIDSSKLLEIMYKQNIKIIQEDFLYVYNNQFMDEIFILLNEIMNIYQKN